MNALHGTWLQPAAPPQPQRSPQWFRLSPLRPLLPTTVRHQRQVLRGQVWHTLTGADGRCNFRLNAAAWSAIARCDGQHTVHQLWLAAQALHANHAPTQNELLQMLARLHESGLLSFDRAPDFGSSGPAASGAAGAGAAAFGSGADGRRHHRGDHPQHRQHLLAWRVSLGNPARLLNVILKRLAWLTPSHQPSDATAGRSSRALVSWIPASIPARLPAVALCLWLLLMTGAATAALLQAPELRAALGRLMAAPLNGWVLALAYPLMKLLHEVAHGVVARRYGAVVSDWGITWLMFMPVPYVDASAASALPRRRQRLAVSAAGIVAELSVAAVACLLALAVQAGALRDTALLVFYLALGSSLLVNANPLLRFDGYHMLCDALGLPNLAARSARHWQQVLRRTLLAQNTNPGAGALADAAPGEKAWLWAYAPAAMVMRSVVALAVVLWLGGLWPLLGHLALAVFAWTLLLAPAARLLQGLNTHGWRPPLPQTGVAAGAPGPHVAQTVHTVAPFAARALWRAVPMATRALPAGLLLAVLLCPVPVASVAQGVWWLPESALVRAQGSGFVAQVLVADGQPVQAGDAVLTLHAPALQAHADKLQGRVQELQAEQQLALRNDPATAAAAEHALQAAQAEGALAQQRLQRLTVRAQASGRIALGQAADLPGRYIERGALLAHVVTGDAGIVKLAIAQHDAARLPTEPSTVQVLAADNPSAPRTGRWLGAPTGAQAQLPSAALGSRSGGRVAVDPADTAGRRPVQPVVLGEVQLSGAPASHIGQRVLVRFDHGHAPLLVQAARAGQQLLLRHFNPAR